jgi:hypothetical protein
MVGAIPMAGGPPEEGHNEQCGTNDANIDPCSPPTPKCARPVSDESGAHKECNDVTDLNRPPRRSVVGWASQGNQPQFTQTKTTHSKNSKACMAKAPYHHAGLPAI